MKREKTRISAPFAIALASALGCSGEVGAPSAEVGATSATVPFPGAALPPGAPITPGGVGAPVDPTGLGSPGSPAAIDPVTGEPLPLVPGQPVAPGSGSAPGAPVDPASPASSPGEGNPLAFVAPTPEAPDLRGRTWKLTHEQYAQSVRELVGVLPDLSNFVPETSGVQFSNSSSTGFVRVDLADNYMDTARDIAQGLTEQQLAGFSACDLSASCADVFVETLASRAFRRPAQPAEVTSYRELFDTAAAGGDALQGFRAVVQGLLNSPLFLYRTEIGSSESEAQTSYTLSNHEVASLLSYSLLGLPPSEGLLAAADRGELTDLVSLPAHVRTLLAEPAASAQLGRFISEWLEVTHFAEVEKFPDVFPGFDSIREAMAAETASFLASSASATSTLTNLFLDPVVAGDAGLQQFYASDPSAPPVSTRVGVLGLGTVLAHHAKAYLTSPTLRGAFVRKRMFCQEITLPEGFTPPPLSETENEGIATTTRELYERHQSDPTCAPCHRLTDNIGFSLEEFDGAGRFRTIDTTQGDAQPVNPAATLTDSDVNRPITNHVELAEALSESELVRECMARQAFRFYFGQGEASRGQLPIIEGHAALQQSAQLGEMLAALMSTESSIARRRE